MNVHCTDSHNYRMTQIRSFLRGAPQLEDSDAMD